MFGDVQAGNPDQSTAQHCGEVLQGEQGCCARELLTPLPSKVTAMERWFPAHTRSLNTTAEAVAFLSGLHVSDETLSNCRQKLPSRARIKIFDLFIMFQAGQRVRVMVSNYKNQHTDKILGPHGSGALQRTTRGWGLGGDAKHGHS